MSFEPNAQGAGCPGRLRGRAGVASRPVCPSSENCTYSDLCMDLPALPDEPFRDARFRGNRTVEEERESCIFDRRASASGADRIAKAASRQSCDSAFAFRVVHAGAAFSRDECQGRRDTSAHVRLRRYLALGEKMALVLEQEDVGESSRFPALLSTSLCKTTNPSGCEPQGDYSQANTLCRKESVHFSTNVECIHFRVQTIM